jgi:hypothetical protein
VNTPVTIEFAKLAELIRKSDEFVKMQNRLSAKACEALDLKERAEIAEGGLATTGQELCDALALTERHLERAETAEANFANLHRMIDSDALAMEATSGLFGRACRIVLRGMNIDDSGKPAEADIGSMNNLEASIAIGNAIRGSLKFIRDRFRDGTGEPPTNMPAEFWRIEALSAKRDRDAAVERAEKAEAESARLRGELSETQRVWIEAVQQAVDATNRAEVADARAKFVDGRATELVKEKARLAHELAVTRNAGEAWKAGCEKAEQSLVESRDEARSLLNGLRDARAELESLRARIDPGAMAKVVASRINRGDIIEVIADAIRDHLEGKP